MAEFLFFFSTFWTNVLTLDVKQLDSSTDGLYNSTLLETQQEEKINDQKRIFKLKQ